jgi:CubicO group peptidase (beta-lactamase class C family)
MTASRRPVRTRPVIAAVLIMLLAAHGDAGRAAAQRADHVEATGYAAAVDSLFDRWASPASPGAAVLVLHRGAPVHARGYGMAHLEHGVPIGMSTVFDLASVSKQFGAMAIALLEADGLVSLDDDVRKYLPELYDFGSTITLRHLVHHTSGIRDWPGTMRIAGWDYRDVMSFDQILRLAWRQRELNFAPGSEHAYSNTGYNLLAEVVQRVSGRSFREFTDERIFKPLGMHDTHFHDDITRIVPGRAVSYSRAADGSYRHVTSGLTALGSSSLFSTPADLAKWVANFGTGAVGGAAALARMNDRGVLTTGDTIPYAFGQSIRQWRGTTSVSHTGSWAGYRTILLRLPEHDFSVIILANTSEINTTEMAASIAGIFLEDVLTPLPPAQAAATPASAGAAPVGWTPDAAALDAFTGSYTSDELETVWTLRVVSGQLVAEHFRSGTFTLQPVSEDRFRSALFGEIRFYRTGNGEVAGFTANSDRVRNLRFIKGR